MSPNNNVLGLSCLAANAKNAADGKLDNANAQFSIVIIIVKSLGNVDIPNAQPTRVLGFGELINKNIY